MRHWRITGNSNVAIQTGSTYISDSMTDITAISTANLGFLTTPRAKTLTPGDCDNDRQTEIAIWTFCLPILQFLAVDCCHSHLANLLSSSTSSRIWRWNLDAICQSSRDVSISSFGRHMEKMFLSLIELSSWQGWKSCFRGGGSPPN